MDEIYSKRRHTTLEVILSGKSGSSCSREGDKKREIETEQNNTTNNNATIMTTICATPMFKNKLQTNKE